jgi:hypothetical protein
LSCNHYNGNRFGRLSGTDDPWERHDNHDIDLELHEFGHKNWQTIQFSRSVAVFNLDIFAFDVTEISESLSKRIAICIGSLRSGFARSREIANPWNFPRLLRLGECTCGKEEKHDYP